MKKIILIVTILVMIFITNVKAETNYFLEWASRCDINEIRELNGHCSIYIEFADRDGYIELEAESPDADIAEMFVYVNDELVMNTIVTEETITNTSIQAYYLIYISGI